jgi:cell division protein FtsI/penicillin-binding protein 2
MDGNAKSQQTWYPTETLDVSIGQGAVSAHAAAKQLGQWEGLASGGRLVQPHLVDPGQC